MYYLFRTNGTLKLLDGELVNGMICKKSGTIFNRKWTPILAEAVLAELGLLEKAKALLNTGDTFAVLTDRLMATGVYRPGENVEGTIIGSEELPAALAAWLKSSGMDAEIEKNLPQVLPSTKEYIHRQRLGMFGSWAETYMREAGSELTQEQFNAAMMRALRHAHVKPQ